MFHKLKNLFSANELLNGNFGIEREGLRITENCRLSQKKHPAIFGDKILNPYITTDFSESQLEVITPPLKSPKETYDFLNSLYDIVAIEIDDEYIWPQSMPIILRDGENIPVAEFGDDEEGIASRTYRENLINKYGGNKQLISGIHYNFSFDENIIKKLYEDSDKVKEYKNFKDDIYLKVARNYLRYRWLVIYLLGSSSIMHKSYDEACTKEECEILEDIYSNEGTISYRNSDYGYKNKEELFPSYESTIKYVTSINGFVTDKILESHKELYSQVRLKPRDNNDFINSLVQSGINYLEFRSIDINPFCRAGLELEDIEFLHVFSLFLLGNSESDYSKWQEEAMENQKRISSRGLSEISLIKDGIEVSKKVWGIEILENMLKMDKELNLGKEDIIRNMLEKVNNPKLTYAYRIKEKVKREGFTEAHLSLAKTYKQEAYKNRYKLVGFENLELSTQLLLREAIKRGISVDVIDSGDNFISLSQGERIEYIKQATKTSKDNYVSVMIMENKTVTKKILDDNNIRTPKGIEINSKDKIKAIAKEYKYKPIVIKPKSTNFGMGISIFKNGAIEDDIKKALDIAFKYDENVLLEEFVRGKEYRFLVINNKVVGILHRVPANVIGNGSDTIRQLVEIKNKDSLRGRGYKTPLEKIKLDENAELFLKQKDMTFDYIPKDKEIVYLRENSNISTGGDSIDFTDIIFEKYKKIAIDCAKSVRANICGVDMMIEDYTDEDSPYAIIELNFNPAIHIHSFPYKGQERRIAAHIIKLLGFNIG